MELELFPCILLPSKRESVNFVSEFTKVDNEINLFTLILDLILKILYS